MQERLQVEAVAAEVERRPEERRHEAVAAEAEGLHNALRSQQARLCCSICLAEHQECPKARRGIPSAASATDSASGVPPSPMSHCKSTPLPTAIASSQASKEGTCSRCSRSATCMSFQSHVPSGKHDTGATSCRACCFCGGEGTSPRRSNTWSPWSVRTVKAEGRGLGAPVSG